MKQKEVSFEEGTKTIVSILFRILLMTYSLLILSSSSNYFKNYVYVLSFFAYGLIYVLTFRRKLSKARLLNDFLFIILVLYGKEMNNFFLIIFIFLPIINTQNHTGKSQSFILYLYTILAYLFLSWQHVSIFFFYSLAALFVINLFMFIRRLNARMNKSILKIVDDFDLSNLSLGKTHRLYKELIKKLNSTGFSKLFFKTQNISCFVLDKSSLLLFNSSEFIWSYEVDIAQKDIISLNNDETCRNIRFKINQEDYVNTLLFPIKHMNKIYVFLFITYNNYRSFVFINSLLYKNIYPLLKRCLKVIDLDTQLREERANLIKSIKDKYKYINNAKLAMHYLRNKMSPISFYFEMYDELQQMDSTEVTKKNELYKIFEDETKKVKTSLKLIVEKTDQILEKSSNPFIISQLTTMPVHTFFYLLRRVWQEYFLSSDIKLEWDIKNVQHSFLLNYDGLEILFTDIIENMATYSSSYREVILEEDIDFYYVLFKNNVKNNGQQELINLNKIVEDFNSEDNYEISKRTTNGIAMIKEFLKQMQIRHKLCIEGDILILKLILQKNHENTII